MGPLAGVTSFTMRRRVTPREQYHEFRPVGPDGVEGDVVLYGSPRQMSLVEEYRFTADREHTLRCWTVRARSAMNLGDAVFDVVDDRGAPIGWFQIRWLESQVLHTWRLVGPGVDLVGNQHHVLGGMLRTALARAAPVLGLVPVRRGFDVRFRDANGQVYLRVEGRGDRYAVTTPGGWVDPRLAAGMATLLDFRGSL